MYREYYASSLSQFFELVMNSQLQENENGPAGEQRLFEPLWFRGQTESDWSLLPSLLRSNEIVKRNSNDSYTSLQMEEDMRTHHFGAKVNHLIDKSPQNRIEWQELMQHHGVATRLMDWSESAIKALLFALEPLIDPGDDPKLQEKRSSLTPAVWLLNPRHLNWIVYKMLCTRTEAGYPYIEHSLNDLLLDEGERAELSQQLGDELSKNTEAGNMENLYMGKSLHPAMDRIISLSALDMSLSRNQSRLTAQLRRFEINPFHYLLARYYSDGVAIPAEGLPGVGILPPLAIVHPYHNERIRQQHGVFSVFPSYYLGEYASTLKKCGVELRALEMQPSIVDCVCKIHIVNPFHIAHQLLAVGERNSSLYPDIDQYTKDIEAKGYYT